jgi:actin-related protein
MFLFFAERFSFVLTLTLHSSSFRLGVQHSSPVQFSHIVSNFVVGAELEELRDVLLTREVVQRGKIVHWEGVDSLIEQSFSSLLRTAIHPDILVCEPAHFPQSSRDRLEEILFDRLRPGSVGFMGHGDAVAYAQTSTQRTMLTVDIGDQLVQVLPIVEGFIVSDVVDVREIGGKDMALYLKQICSSFEWYSPDLDDWFWREALEKVACVGKKGSESNFDGRMQPTKDHKDQEDVDLSSQVVEILHPLGHQVCIPRKHGASAVECLFNPRKLNRDCKGLSEMIVECIKNVDLHVRAQLMKNIVLGGGCANIAGLGDRVLSDVQDAFPESTVNVTLSKDPSNWQWRGCSKIAPLPSVRASVMQSYLPRSPHKVSHLSTTASNLRPHGTYDFRVGDDD